MTGCRQELGAEAAAVFQSFHDPRWNRDGLTGWDFEDLPDEISVARGNLVMKAYPTLIDGGESVSLRLVDSPERCVYESRFGLRRLYQLAAWRELKTQVDWLPGIDKMRSHAAVQPGFDLRKELADLLADRAFFAEGGMPRNEAEFQSRLQAGRQRIGLAVQEVATLMGPWFEACHEAFLALEPSRATAGKPKVWGRLSVASPAAGVKWQYALDDIRDQLVRLAGPKCLGSTPWEWLRHCPRYFQAITTRLDALAGGGMARDRQRFEEFLPWWEGYLQRAEQHEAQGIFDPELVQFRWMLEEYRVSLFAQKLGTAVPVSAKRLEQQWAKVRG
jgi:ATP-dependent helicase HrpA